MAKKKLTKAKVRQKYAQMGLRISEILDDKLKHPDSFVPQSMPKLLELYNTIFRIVRKF